MTVECKRRLGTATPCVVYGVDREIGLTSEAKYNSENIAKYKLITPGMFAYNPMRLNIGSIAYSRPGNRVGVVSPDYVVFQCDERVLLHEYLRWYIQSREWQNWTTAAGVGSVRVRIYYSELARMPLLIPSIGEQRSIAEFLDNFDRAITSYRCTSNTLESMARAVFKSWFVDFDPVRAKAEGRQPEGMNAETAALFPSAFETTTPFHSPTGWQVRPLSDLVETIFRGIGPTYTESGGTLVIGQRCVRDFHIDFAVARRHDETAAPVVGRMLLPWDVLINSTGQGTLGRVAQIVSLPEPATVDGHVTVVRCDVHKSDPHYVAFNLSGRQDEIENMATGSTGQTGLSKERVVAMPIIVPPLELQSAFGSIVTPMRLTADLNARESATLTSLRDTLLPKLLSGEIRIREAEKVVEAAV